MAFLTHILVAQELSDYGDVLFSPTVGEVLYNNGADGNPGYSSKFSHNNESAHAGYYQVYLEDYDVNVELSASKEWVFISILSLELIMLILFWI
ncbi:MAG: hypothetical protein CM15mP107_2290 [Bacteroidota bacterium]|nr:MAG: hypothetical protein CM15mP107_2290 [Bacteroidota bacterium]